MSSATVPGNALSAGAGRAALRLPPEAFPIEGYTGSRTPLHARVLVLVDDSSRHVLCSLELPSLRDYEVTRLRDQLAAAASTTPDQVWVCVTHTLSAPHTRSEQALRDADTARRNALFCAALEDACTEAVEGALAGLQPCRVGSATTVATLNVNRDLPVAGGWGLGPNPGRHSDRTLAVVVVEGVDGSPLALLYNYDLRSSVTDAGPDGRGGVSADCTGAASALLESAWGGVACFLPGAMGDQAPILGRVQTLRGRDGAAVRHDLGEAGHVLSDAVGAALAERVLAAAATVEARSAGLDAARAECRVETATSSDSTPTFAPDTLALDVLVLGDAALLALRPELTSVLGTRIRQASPWPRTLVCTMVDGGAGYLADDEAHVLGTWAATRSGFAAGAGDAVVEAAATLLHTVHSRRETR